MMAKKSLLQNPIIVCLIALICCALWGSAFPFIKIGYRVFGIHSDAVSTQIVFAGARFTVAGVLTILMGSIVAKQIILPKKSSYKRIAILSLFQTILQYVCFYIGLAHTTGVKSSILTGANVFVAIGVSVFIFKQEKLTKRKVIGSVIGFIGVVIANIAGTAMDFSFKMNGEALILLSTIAASISSSIIKRYAVEENTVMLSGYQFIFGGIVMMLIGFSMGGRLESSSVTGTVVLIYLALVSAIAYTLWGILLKYNPVSSVAIYGFMTPIFGVILSTILIQETGQSFGIREQVALLLIAIGIIIVQKKHEKKGRHQ